ncbi:hypothetical protein T492DRAFT_854289, partial [Pavlovales sp. CCMP2436]
MADDLSDSDCHLCVYVCVCLCVCVCVYESGRDEAERERVAKSRQWPAFGKCTLNWDEAVRLWCELLLKSELDPDFERLVL